MAYCTKADIEYRIGRPRLIELTNDTWAITPPANLAVANASGGSLSAGETYYYKVTAYGPKGETIGCTEASNTANATNATMNLTWANVTGAMGYRVFRSNASGTYGATSFLGETSNANYADAGTSNLTTGSPTTNNYAVDETILSAIIARADGEIDSKAGQVYTVPFATTPTIIKQISIDMVVYFLYLRRFTEMEVPKQWQDAYKHACDLLESVSNMLVYLDQSPAVASAEADIEASAEKIDFYNDDNEEYYF